jgi:hypothetical protein
MGTLVEKKSGINTKSINRSPEVKAQLKLQEKNSKKLSKEYHRLRKQMEELRQAYAAVDSASETDDIYYRLQNLEKVSKKLRKGGAISKGAKVHRKLLKKMR